MRYRAALCLALRCCAVLCRAFIRTYSSTRYHAIAGTAHYVCTCVLDFFICFLYHFIVLFRSSFPPRILHPHTGDQKVTSPTSKGQSALRIYQPLALSNRSMHQIMGLSFFCRLHIYLYSYLRERSGRRQPPAERCPCVIKTIYTVQL